MGEPTSKESKRIAVVTGGNKGIGLEICRQLSSSSHGLMVILTSRDEGRGTDAVERLKAAGASGVLFHQLDVADPSSVALLADFIRTQFGRLDILVNNAGVGGITVDSQPSASFKEEISNLRCGICPSHQKKITRPLAFRFWGEEFGGKKLQEEHFKLAEVLDVAQETYEKAEECLNINYYGMKRVTEALLPFLQLSQSPRIVNVSSVFGLLRVIPGEDIRKAMAIVDEHTEERIDETLQLFLNDLKEGKLKDDIWPVTPAAYRLSKVAMNTYTRFLADRYPTICINCVAPGFVKTDLTNGMGLVTAKEGANGPVMAALLPDGSPSGLLYDGTQIISFA